MLWRKDKDIQENIETSYDYGIYREKILRMNFIIAVVVLVIEIAISILLYLENAIEQSAAEYLARFLIIPTIINFSFVGLQNHIIKSDNHSEKVKNHISTISLAVICSVVSYTHYVFACTLLVYCIPIFTSVLFSDKRITERVKIVCLLGVLITGIERYILSSSNGDTKVYPEVAISVAVVFLATYIAEELISLITEQNGKLIKSKKEAEESRDEADRANTAKGQFLASMSHEIRTPINAILGLDTMILRQSAEENTVKFAKDIQSAGRNLLGVINDILDFSKIESGKMELVCGDYDFASLLNDVINMIRPKAEEKGLELDFYVDKHLPSRFYGDDLRIKQILVNLLTNAIKYTPSGKVILEITFDMDGDDAIVHYAVKDTGIGIKPEDISKISEEYVRIEESRNKNIEGTGLGTNIVINFLKMMGSRLQISSVYGEGSNFHFDLRQPVTNMQELGDFTERIKNFAGSEEYQVAFCIPSCRLLVVDDNSMNRSVFKNLLLDMECTIDEAESGAECLALVEKQKYDIIFLDHMMPEMDGIETFRHMKEKGEYINSQTPIIILTANAISGVREKYLAEGFDDYLSKPIDADKLEKMIGSFIPDDKKKASKKREKVVANDYQKMVNDMPYIDGVDWVSAILKLKSMDLLNSSISGFSLTAKPDMENLEAMFAALGSGAAEDFEAFRIKVHSMKTNAATIGAIHVAGLAKFLEYAAKDCDIDSINRLMPVFKNQWAALKKAIDEAFGDSSDEKDEELPLILAEDLERYFAELTDAMSEIDINRADAVIEKLSAYWHGDNKSLFDELKLAVLNLDADAVARIIEEWSKA